MLLVDSLGLHSCSRCWNQERDLLFNILTHPGVSVECTVPDEVTASVSVCSLCCVVHFILDPNLSFVQFSYKNKKNQSENIFHEIWFRIFKETSSGVIKPPKCNLPKETSSEAMSEKLLLICIKEPVAETKTLRRHGAYSRTTDGIHSSIESFRHLLPVTM